MAFARKYRISLERHWQLLALDRSVDVQYLVDLEVICGKSLGRLRLTSVVLHKFVFQVIDQEA